ncbi:MAG TPA: hypothetical protein VHL34_23395, partial [Rhizomicrobium sp.]|nr:hypothetical protein [Rhizomicrobium sp.]
MSDTTVGNARRTQPWGLWDGFPTVGLDTLVGELLAVAGLTAILLGVAVWNGFPITFYDTGAYVLQGLAEYFVPERAPVYSYFLRYMGGQQSLWLVAGAQCGLIAFV